MNVNERARNTFWFSNHCRSAYVLFSARPPSARHRVADLLAGIHLSRGLASSTCLVLAKAGSQQGAGSAAFRLAYRRSNAADGLRFMESALFHSCANDRSSLSSFTQQQTMQALNHFESNQTY
jgi:hypothetical protein